MTRDGVDLHLFEADERAGPVSLHIFAEGMDALAAEAESRGIGLSQKLETKPWGTRDFRVHNPSGNELKFTEAR